MTRLFTRVSISIISIIYANIPALYRSTEFLPILLLPFISLIYATLGFKEVKVA